MNDKPYKDIEKYIDVDKLPMELVPDIYDEDVGRVLTVNKDLEPVWGENKEADLSILLEDVKDINIQIGEIIKDVNDKVSSGDFEGALESIEKLSTSIDVAQGQIDLVVEKSTIIGAYLPATNDARIDRWINLVRTIESATLHNVLFEGGSGWLGKDSNNRLLISGEQYLSMANNLNSNDDTLEICIDAFLVAHIQKGNSQIINGVYLSDDTGNIAIVKDGIEVRTNTSMPQGTPFHITINIDVKTDMFDVYIDGDKIETTIVTNSKTMNVPASIRAFEGFSGEIYNFKLYKKTLSDKHIKENVVARENSFNGCYHYLVTLLDAARVIPIANGFYEVKSYIQILKDEITIGVSSAIGSSNMSNVKRNVRYIRDTQGGNNKDNVAKWLEVQALDREGNNLLKGIVASSNKPATGLDLATDGNRVDENSCLSIVANGEDAVVMFDLKEVKDNISILKMFRYHLDERTIDGIKTEVSEDGVKWVTVFDGDIKGKFKESIDGQVISVNTDSALDNLTSRVSMAEIKITDEAIISTVSGSISGAKDEAIEEAKVALNAYKAEVAEDFLEISSAHSELESVMNGAFKDGVISEAEAKSIKERLIQLQKEKADIDKEHLVISTNSSLSGTTEKSALDNTKSLFDVIATTLDEAITVAISDGLATVAEVDIIDSSTTEYKVALSNYRESFVLAVDKIGDVKVKALDIKTESKFAQMKITTDEITSTVASTGESVASNKADIEKKLNDYKLQVSSEFLEVVNATSDLEVTMNGAFADSIISKSEAKAINERLVQTEKEYGDVVKEVDVLLGNSSLTGVYRSNLIFYYNKYKKSYADFYDNITAGISDDIVNDLEVGDIKVYTEIYKTAISLLKESMMEAIDAIGTVKVNELSESTDIRFAQIKVTTDEITSTVVSLDGKVDQQKETIDTDIANYKAEVDAALEGVDTAHLDLVATMNGAFKDGIISEAEAKAINERLVQVTKENEELDNEFDTIYANPYLSREMKSKIIASSNDFQVTYYDLIGSIREAIEDGLITLAERHAINIRTNSHNESVIKYSKALADAIDSIESARIKELADNSDIKFAQIKVTTDSITNTVASFDETISANKADIEKKLNDYKEIVDVEFLEVSSATTDLEVTMNNSFRDGVLSDAEKKDIISKRDMLTKEHNDVISQIAAVKGNSQIADALEMIELKKKESELVENFDLLTKAINDSIINQGTKSLITFPEDVFNIGKIEPLLSPFDYAGAGFTLSKNKVSLALEGVNEEKISYTIVPANITEEHPVATMSTDGVCKVDFNKDNSLTIVGVSGGSTVVTITLNSLLSVTCKVTVVGPSLIDTELKKYMVTLKSVRESIQKCLEKIAQVKVDVVGTEFSEFKQTTDEFKFSVVNNSGVGNILPNSDFTRYEIWQHPDIGNHHEVLVHGWESWAYGTDHDMNQCELGIHDHTNEWGYKSPTEKTVFIKDKNNYTLTQEGTELGILCRPHFIVGETYTLKCKLAAHRAPKIIITVKGTKDNATAPLVWTQIEDINTGGPDINNWTHVSITFVAERSDNAIVFLIKGPTANDPYLWVTQPILVKGIICPDYVVSNKEISSGITTIDDRGVKVSMSDGEGNQGSSRFSHDGMVIYDNNNHKKAHFGQGDSAYINKLSCDVINNPTLVKMTTQLCPSTLYVSTNATGDGTGRDTSNKSNSISHTIRWLKETYGVYLEKNITVSVEGGTYYEEVLVDGLLGRHWLQIKIHGSSTWHGWFYFYNNVAKIYIYGRDDYNTWSNWGCKCYTKKNDMFSISKSSVEVIGFRSMVTGYNAAHGNWNGYAKQFVYAISSDVLIYNNDISGYYTAVYSSVGGHVALYNNRGHVQIGAQCLWGGLVLAKGYAPKCQHWAGEDRAGHFTDKGMSEHNSSEWPKQEPDKPVPPPPVPPPEWGWTERSFSSTSLRATPEGSGNATSPRTGEWGQGHWGSWQAHRGYCEFGNDPSSWCSGGRNFSGWITLRRIRSGGYSGAVPKPQIKKPDGSNWDSNTAFAHGDQKTIQLPSDIVGAIANGSVKTLVMWAGKNQNQYSFYDLTTIKIKCEKKV